jgi:glycosyltransferase involved in cell wall biosynthesis
MHEKTYDVPMKCLRWLGPILDCSGYAAAARGYLRACEAVGLPVRACDRSRSLNLAGKGMDPSILNMYERLSSTTVPEDCPTVQHQVPDCLFLDRKSSYPVGYTIFEMPRIPQGWVPYCNRMAAIWTGSSYSRDAFVSSGVTVPVSVLPHAIDLEAFSPAAESWKLENRRSFTFLSVLDFHARKAWKETLRAYWSAFGPEDDVCLILKAFFGGFDEGSKLDIARRIASFRQELGISKAAPILLYGYDVPARDMPGLYRAADCYVGISREGFGLSYAEAMACGLPCIGPEAGGVREFMTPENSFLVKYTGEEPIAPEMVRMFPSFEGLSWATHSWEHLAETMRHVVENPDARKARAERGLADVRARLNFRAIGQRLLDLLPEKL